MRIQMFSTKPLPNHIRAEFELPVWPYKEGPGGDVPIELRDYLKKLTIFRYEDDHDDGRGSYLGGILIPDNEGRWPSEWESPIHCYQHLVWVDDDYLTVIKWPNDRPEGRELHKQIVQKIGDNLAWGEFNKSVVLHRVTAQMVHYISGHNVPGNISIRREVKI